jgi:hypothetical protein
MARRTGSRSCLARLPLSGLEQDGPALDVDTRLSMGRGPCRDSNAQRAVVEASAHLCQQALSGGLNFSISAGIIKTAAAKRTQISRKENKL